MKINRCLLLLAGVVLGMVMLHLISNGAALFGHTSNSLQQSRKVSLGEMYLPSTNPYNLKCQSCDYYSQFLQDATLEDILSSVQDGFFVESGAQNGEDNSNTLKYEKDGWEGLLVEPLPSHFKELLSKNRKAHIFHGALSTTKDAKLIQFDKGMGGTHFKPAITVPSWPLSSLLRLLNRSVVDFWSLDLDGPEASVLENFDFDHIEVGVLLSETVNQVEVQDIMIKRGFKRIGFSWFKPGVFNNISTATRGSQWSKLDEIYVNPSYFMKRGLRVPDKVDEDLERYDAAVRWGSRFS